MRVVSEFLGHHLYEGIASSFQQRGLADRLLFNDNFKPLHGGPRWTDIETPGSVCFRKYIGVRGHGDFTLVTRHPVGLLAADEVIHSHTGALIWPRHVGDAPEFPLFSSIRNPFGILNSACFSINALTSEYIQRFMPPDVDQNAIRDQLAAYKLSDQRFFSSLAVHLRRELEEYLVARDRYVEMRWEALIREPVPTIALLADALGIDLPESEMEAIWRDIGFRNLTGAHKHNFRPGAGQVGSWKRSLVQRHLDIARETGLAPVMEALGYDPDERIESSQHSPFQRQVDDAIRNGRVLKSLSDEDLFWFAFNKTNIDFSQFGFRIGEWRKHVRLERSCLDITGMEDEIAEYADNVVSEINQILEELSKIPSNADMRKEYHRVVRDHVEDSRQLHGPATAGLLDALRAPHGSSTGAWRRAVSWFSKWKH